MQKFDISRQEEMRAGYWQSTRALFYGLGAAGLLAGTLAAVGFGPWSSFVEPVRIIGALGAMGGAVSLFVAARFQRGPVLAELTDRDIRFEWKSGRTISIAWHEPGLRIVLADYRSTPYPSYPAARSRVQWMEPPPAGWAAWHGYDISLELFQAVIASAELAGLSATESVAAVYGLAHTRLVRLANPAASPSR